MPIHDQGYRRYAGRREPRRRTWWVIARAGIRERVRERRCLALLLLAWAPFAVRAVQIYVAENVSAASFLAPGAGTFREFLDQQNLFVFFVTIYAGAGLIANDRRANALQIYLARPVTRLDYVTGKLVTLLVFLTAVTWVPAMLLLALQVMFSASTAFLRSNLFLVPAITVFCAIQVLVSALAMLALSSLSKSRRFAAVMYASLIFLTAALYQALRGMTGSSRWAWLSPEDAFDVLADAIFRIPGSTAMPVPAAALVTAVLAAVSVWILSRRVRAVEINI